MEKKSGIHNYKFAGKMWFYVQTLIVDNETHIYDLQNEPKCLSDYELKKYKPIEKLKYKCAAKCGIYDVARNKFVIAVFNTLSIESLLFITPHLICSYEESTHTLLIESTYKGNKEEVYKIVFDPSYQFDFDKIETDLILYPNNERIMTIAYSYYLDYQYEHTTNTER